MVLDLQRRLRISDLRTVTKRDIERYPDEADREDLDHHFDAPDEGPEN